MRIAKVAPLHERVPPKLYGGTERIVSYLTEEFDRLEIRGVQIRDVHVDLSINRGRGGVTVEKVNTRGDDVEIIVR